MTVLVNEKFEIDKMKIILTLSQYVISFFIVVVSFSLSANEEFKEYISDSN